MTRTATLCGATVNASFAAGTDVARQYTILHAADGVTGTFGTEVNTNLPTNFHTALSYDGNNAYLNLILNFAVPSGKKLIESRSGTRVISHIDILRISGTRRGRKCSCAADANWAIEILLGRQQKRNGEPMMFKAKPARKIVRARPVKAAKDAV